MEQATLIPLFQLGEVVATEDALNAVDPVYGWQIALHGYARRLGLVCEKDVETNNAGVREDGRLLSTDPSTGFLGVSVGKNRGGKFMKTELSSCRAGACIGSSFFNSFTNDKGRYQL